MTTQKQRGSFRKKEQKERDRGFIATLFVKNYGLVEMSNKLHEFVKEAGDDYKLTPQQIWYDCKQILIEWKKTRLKEIDDYIDIELKKLDRIENELWVAWDKSKTGKFRKKLKGGEIDASGNLSGGKLKEQVFEETSGNSKYLDLILDVMERRAKLLGYNAPLRLEINRPKEKDETQETVLDKIPANLALQMADVLMNIKRVNPALN
jgi:hypothetical protein